MWKEYMTPKLSPLTDQLVSKFFEAGDRLEATRLLVEECGNNLPFCKEEDEFKMERIRFAALRVSLGYLEDLQRAIAIAKSDWRDLLVAADFADSLTAHQTWARQALRDDPNAMVIVLTGLSGSGKTMVGKSLARELGWKFYEGDHFHTTQNITKLIHGQPISDEEIQTWLEKLNELIGKHLAKKQSALLGCTALKEAHRQALCSHEAVYLVYLQASAAQLEERQKTRKMQLSNLERLAYQRSIFEEPQDVLAIDAGHSPLQIVELIRRSLEV